MIAVSVSVLTACSSGNEASEPVPTTLAPAPTSPATSTTAASPAAVTTTALATTTTIDEKAAVLAAYVEYRAAVKQLFARPDLNSPAFETLMTGRQREAAKRPVQERIDTNSRTESPPNSIARETSSVESVGGANAVVVSCFVDDSFRRFMSDGTTGNLGVQTSLLRALMLKEAGRWKVEFLSIERVWDGIAGCAA